jgi:hypothetical protein
MVYVDDFSNPYVICMLEPTIRISITFYGSADEFMEFCIEIALQLHDAF